MKIRIVIAGLSLFFLAITLGLAGTIPWDFELDSDTEVAVWGSDPGKNITGTVENDPDSSGDIIISVLVGGSWVDHSVVPPGSTYSFEWSDASEIRVRKSGPPYPSGTCTGGGSTSW